jgi:hypothetical protein
VHGLGCEMAQGFFIGRPMRGDLVPEWVEHYLVSATNPKTAAAQFQLARAEA